MAGLLMVGEPLPLKAGPARLADAATLHNVKADVFGYPDGPARTKIGAWGAPWCAAR